MNLILLAAEKAVEHASDAGFIGTLGLNWKLFIAQLVNFGIVLLILWKWVFRPVVGALEKRREKIEDSVRKAEEIEKRMKEFEEQREVRMRSARAEAQEILKNAREAASFARAETIAQARSEAEKVLTEAKADIESEKQKMLKEIREEVADLTLMATEKILREKLDEKRDRKIVEEVLKSVK